METRLTDTRLDLDAALLKAQVKARLLGWPEEPVRLGRFEIEICLGRGGVGSVYAARDTASGARVALKRLHAAALAATALRREFRALSSIVHPNLVALHELFCVHNQWFLTMELVEGVDLMTHLRAQGPAERDSAAEQALRDSFAQVLAGVAAIHDASKIHRDLKPSNVLIARGGRSVILDYGLVVDQGAQLDDPAQAGTPSYMAPELLASGSVQPPVDLYALGTMLFLALTGRLPARCSNPRTPTPEALLRPSAWAPSIAEDLDQLCADLLAHEPARRPSADQARARVLGQRERGSRPPQLNLVPAFHEPFVGRHAQLEALRAAFAGLGDGPSVAWVHGASGMGKSALLRRFCAEQRGAGCFVLEARCYERENTPFKVFDGVAESLVRYLERMPVAEVERMLPSRAGALLDVFPAFARLSAFAQERPSTPRLGDPFEQQRIAFSALRALLERCCELQPVVIAVDDLQWGDVDSVRLFQSLLAPPSAPRQLFVGAFRGDEATSSPFLRRALSPAVLGALACPVIDLSVDLLDVDEVDALVRQVGARNPGAFDAARLEPSIHEAAGMPFLLCELLQQGARDPHAAAPHKIEDFVSSRVVRCSASGQRLLTVLCVAGRPLGLTLALQAASLGDTAWPAASELCSLRLARWRDTDGERCIEPYHDYVRQTVLAHTDALATSDAQSGIAAAMQRLGIDEPEHLLGHLVAAGERERAGVLALTAARRAELATAWHRASELYRTALSLLDAQAAAQHGVRERLSTALAHAAEHEAAAEAYLASATLAQGDEATRLLRLAAHQLMLAGRSDEGIALLKRLLHAVGFRYPDSQASIVPRFVAARARLELAQLWRFGKQSAGKAAVRSHDAEQRLQTLSAAYRALITHDPERGSLIHAHFLREARGGDDRHALDALMWEISQRALVLGVADEPKLGELVAEARRIAGVLRSPYEGALWQGAEAMFLIHCREQPREGLVALERAADLLAECPGCYFERSWLAYAREYALGLVGRLAEQAALCREREREALERKDSYSLRQLLPSLPLVRLLEGRPDAALRFLDTRWDGSAEQGTFFEYVALLRRSDVQLYLGDARAAYDVLAEHWPRLLRQRAFGTPVLRVNVAFFRARNALALYWRTREPALRRELGDGVDRDRVVPMYARGLFHALEGSAARADGRNEQARAALRASLAELAQSQADHAAMCVRYRLAQLDDAHEELGRVHQWFVRQGVRDPEAWISLVVPGLPGWRQG